MGCGCTDSTTTTSSTTGCNQDCGCKHTLSFACVRYEGESQECMPLVKGDNLEAFVQKLNDKFCLEGVQNYVVITEEPAGDNCEVGGVKIEVKLLETDAIVSTNYVCNGVIPDTTKTYDLKVSLTPSQIKNAATTPITVITSPGVGKAVQILSLAQRYYNSTVAYNATTYELKTATALASHVRSTNCLSGTANVFSTLTAPYTTSVVDVIVENQNVTFVTNTDSVNGDASLDLYITYKIIEI